MVSPRAVEPTRSQKTTVTVLRYTALSLRARCADGARTSAFTTGRLASAAAENPGETARTRRLRPAPLVAARQAPRGAGCLGAGAVRVTAAREGALRRDQHVRLHRVEAEPAERTAIGRRLVALRAPERPPRRLLELRHGGHGAGSGAAFAAPLPYGYSAQQKPVKRKAALIVLLVSIVTTRGSSVVPVSSHPRNGPQLSAKRVTCVPTG